MKKGADLAPELLRPPVAPVRQTPAPAGAILARAEAFGVSFERLAGDRVNPLSLVIDDIVSPVRAVVGGKPTLLFGTNSYLGMNFRPECIRAAQEAAQRYGVGSTASRVAAGNHALHRSLEKEVAAFHGAAEAIVFSTGFMTNLGVISSLAREGRNSKQALASSVRPSRASMASSRSRRACRCSTSEAA